MYTAATWTFAQAIGAEFLTVVPRVFLWIAIVAWCMTFFGMMRYLLACSAFQTPPTELVEALSAGP